MNGERIVGHGIDLVAIDKLQTLLDTEGESLLGTYLTETEVTFARHTAAATRARYLAGRIAAKEAISKALGTGISGNMSWTDIEIGADPVGAPTVTLHGDAQAVALGLGVESWFVSISHEGPFAIASAIGVCRV